MIRRSDYADIAITGIGLITPLGDDYELLLAALRRGETAAAAPTRFDPAPFDCRLVAEIKGFDPEAMFGENKALRLMNQDALYAITAARKAVLDSGLFIGTHYSPEQVGLFGATGMAGIALDEVAPLITFSTDAEGRFDPRLFGSSALHKVRPTLSFKILSNMPICFVSIFENLMGENAIFNPWENQGARAIRQGVAAILEGRVDAALVGGCDVKAHELGFIALQQQGIFAGQQTKGPVLVPGEGAAFLVLERAGAARKRGGRIHALLTASLTAIEKPSPSLAGAPPRDAVHHDLIESGFADTHPAGFIAVCDGKARDRENEQRAIKKYKFPVENFLNPRLGTGNLFAAAAPLQLAIAAHLAHRQADGGTVLALHAGFGGSPGCFLVQPDTPASGRGSSAGMRAVPAPSHTEAPVKVEQKGPQRRVVITGIGLLGPLGNDRETFWNNSLKGVSGIGPVTLFDASGLPVRIGGEVRNLDLEALATWCPTLRGERDRKVWLAATAAREAIRHAGLDGPEAAPMLHRAAFHVGVSLEVFFLQDISGFGRTPGPSQTGSRSGSGEETSHPFATGVTRIAGELLSHLPGQRQPLQTPLSKINDLVGDRLGLGTDRATNCSACAAGAQAIGEAFLSIRSGQTDLALAGAADSMLNPLGLGGFCLLRALSTENDEPTRACRPFDATRTGTVLGEGGAFLVLEELEHARSRGAAILAEIVGYGSSLDAFRVSDPEPTGRGALLAMRRAIADAGLEAHQIDAVNAHGTGTPKNDSMETRVIREVLGKRASDIPVHSLKSMTGHLIAASGAVEAAVAALTVGRGMIPPTINLQVRDPDCDLDYVAEGGRPFAGQTVLSNSFAFGGQNATLIFRRL